jgi:putative two-component system response regulator
MNHGAILCVDDEPSNLGVLRQALKDRYNLVFARSGIDAIEAVDKHQPALILLDVEMPGLDGYEVCRRIKARPSTANIPVIFVTGLSEEANEREGFDAGGVDYITKPISPVIVQMRVRTHLSLVHARQLEESHRSAIHMLGEAGHYNDTDTGVHIWRMAAYSRALAAEVGWTPGRQCLLELAAPMHDTGKIGIPDLVLKKPGPLDAAEWEIMRTHPRIGHQILSKSQAPVFQLAAEIALRHHEKWDGSGYPGNIAGPEIPESARIVAIADVFDALSVKRPYKAAWPLDRVMSCLQEAAGSHLDPRLVDAFVRILPAILDIKAEWDATEHASGPELAFAASRK